MKTKVMLLSNRLLKMSIRFCRSASWFRFLLDLDLTGCFSRPGSATFYRCRSTRHPLWTDCASVIAGGTCVCIAPCVTLVSRRSVSNQVQKASFVLTFFLVLDVIMATFKPSCWCFGRNEVWECSDRKLNDVFGMKKTTGQPDDVSCRLARNVCVQLSLWLISELQFLSFFFTYSQENAPFLSLCVIEPPLKLTQHTVKGRAGRRDPRTTPVSASWDLSSSHGHNYINIWSKIPWKHTNMRLPKHDVHHLKTSVEPQ